MKRLVAVLILISLFAASAASQSKEQIGDTFATMVVHEIDGMVTETMEDQQKGVIVKIIKVPSYYDTELLILKVNHCVNQFNDVKTFKPWTENDGRFDLGLILANRVELVVGYIPGKNQLAIAWFKTGDNYYE